MSEHFEDRHRELRAAEDGERAAWLGAKRDASDVIAAGRLLDWFEARTGPLVDDLVAAVRESAECQNPQPSGPDPSRLGEYVETIRPCGDCWECQLLAGLAALDEASRG